MKITRKIHDYAVFIEFLVGSGLAIFFHVVLRHEEAAYMIFGTGILLSLVTYLVREDIDHAKDRLLGQYRQAHEIPAALARITDPECQIKAHEMIAGTLKNIALLQEGYIPLEDVEFYLEGARLSDQATHRIKAVDPMSAGWLTRGTLFNFYQSNLRALERTVRITRIFVTSHEIFDLPEAQKVLIAQYRDNIDVRVAFRDELPATIDITGRDTSSSFDFAIYDDRAATDVFSQPGRYYGRKTVNPSEVSKYQHLFDVIEHCAHAVTVENDKIVLAAEVVAQSLTSPSPPVRLQDGQNTIISGAETIEMQGDR